MDKKNKKLADINKQKLDLETGISKGFCADINIADPAARLKIEKELTTSNFN